MLAAPREPAAREATSVEHRAELKRFKGWKVVARGFSGRTAGLIP